MIELKNVNKYFNRHKKNQIHVINNANITFPSKGLVALLGPSGSGKTTLLNAIGGLDKISSGSIYVDGNNISGISTNKIDAIRNLNIGYIFQDYKLVENMTVFDNVALPLKINGLKDEEEIKRRVIYTLEKVNMERYKNRPVNMLSGGERQRVGVARALVKNPKIIIADEPTGNLDSKNSLEIMNIIKSISKSFLVVLVTHEEELAKFYADRVIELKDGIITNDYENKNAKTLNYEIENHIYLKDYQEINNIKKDNISIDIYRDNHEDIELRIVCKNGNIYIETNREEKVEVIDNNSSIELINDHYKEIDKVEIDDNTFNIESNDNYKPKYSSIFKLGSFISYGFKKLLTYPLLKKILLGGFFLSGMFIFYSVSSITATLDINDESFISMNKKYLVAQTYNLSVEDYLTYEKLDNVAYLLPSNSIVTFEIKYDKFLQTQFASGIISGSLSSLEDVNSNNIIYGRMPVKDNELVLDVMLVNKFLKDARSKQAGFNKIEDILNHEITLKNMSFIVVGIGNKNEPNIYANKNLFINILANSIKNSYEEVDNNYVDYNLLLNKNVKLVKGKLPINDYEIIVNINNERFMPLNKNIDISINGNKLKVVGYYESINGNNINAYLTNNNMVKYNLIKNANILTIYSKDNEKTINYFKDNKMKIYSSYDYSKEEYMKSIHETTVNTLIASGVILGISLIEILLMIRSSFLSRIKEVGVFRAIGVKKSDIYKMFSGEIFAITIVASFTGIAFMAYILNVVTEIPYIGDMYIVNLFTIGLSLLIVLAFNLFVGLLPVFNTIRKTPAQILSRFDVD